MTEKASESVRSVRLILGDSFKVMAGFDEGSIGSVVTDPPYLINFMSQSFDDQDGASQDPKKMQAWHEGWLKEAYRVLVPGGVIKAFSATRTFHRLAMAMRNVGYVEMRGVLWTYGSGFPKSLNLFKNIEDPKIAELFRGYGTALKPAAEIFVCGCKPRG